MKLLDFIIENIIANSLALINLASEIFLIYMLFRILSDQDKTYQEIRSGTADLIAAGKKLHSMFSMAEKLAQQKNNDHKPAPTSSEDNYNAFFEEQVKESLRKLEALMMEVFSLTDNMMEEPSSELPRWRDSNQQSIQKIIADQQLLKPEISKIQDSIYWLSKELKRASANNVVHAGNGNEQQTIKSYQEMLIKTRERAKNAEQNLQELESQFDFVRKDHEKILAENAEEIESLKGEIKKINDERTSLIRNMDALTNEILRTKVEKEFIENRFIELESN